MPKLTGEPGNLQPTKSLTQAPLKQGGCPKRYELKKVQLEAELSFPITLQSPRGVLCCLWFSVLLRILLQELSCGDCNAISRAWMKLCVAEWKQLKKADFTGSLGIYVACARGR